MPPPRSGASTGAPLAAPLRRRYPAPALTRKHDHAANPPGEDEALFVASCSVTTTRRRRFLWAAWWTAPPTRVPFRKPDAYAGGARSHDEALAQARRAAGVPLVEIEPSWASAWARVLLGRAPWGARADGGASSGAHRRSSAGSSTATTKSVAAAAISIWETLGITARASADDLKRAFRQRALATHPDRGGDPEAFREVHRAFKEAQRRITRRRPARARAR